MDQRQRQAQGRDFTSATEMGKQGKRKSPRPVMMLWKRLQNPFFLVGQGFLLGGILFFATHPESLLAFPI